MRTLQFWSEGDGFWMDTEWETVTSGMRVRCFEEDGTPVPDGTGVYEWDVVKDAYQVLYNGTDLVWQIDIMDPDPTSVPKRNI